MTEFLQLHLLTSYPPANLNRDDLGRPKTAVMGGSTRLRVSSQSLKRAWRESALFQEGLAGHRGWRTREIGKRWVYQPLLDAGVAEKTARAAAEKVANVFGKPDDDKTLIKQLAHVSPQEKEAIDVLVGTLVSNPRELTDDEVRLLRHENRAADIALFGRMLADDPSYNVEAAAQVSHALSVHRVTIEDDFFTAVDDLNDRQEDVGAGHMGETEFAAGVFYLYLCIDLDHLAANLGGDHGLAGRTIAALTEAAATIAPAGKQNSFGSRAYASYVLAERGERQPRSLSVAFLNAIEEDFLVAAAGRLRRQVEAFDAVYGPLADDRCELDVGAGRGSLAALLEFVSRPARGTDG